MTTSQNGQTRPFGLYFHIPACLSKCPYCDFVSYPQQTLGEKGLDRIALLLGAELDLACRSFPDLRGRLLKSIYFGGGTPSLLAPEKVAHLIEKTRGTFQVLGSPEITLECNPLTAETGKLNAFRDAGINRISLGIQSFQEEILQALGRAHGARESKEAVVRVQSGGFASWGLDLIFGAPGSTTTLWEVDLQRAIESGAPHISVYGLTLHIGTPMHTLHEQGRIALPDEEVQRSMFLFARRMLTSAGWRHYEISNYAKPGHEARHNSLYWSGGEYLGLGVSAHSLFGGRRRANPDSMEDYQTLILSGSYPSIPEDIPSVRSSRAERIMLALRRLEGFDPTTLSRELGCNILTEYSDELDRLSASKLLEVSRASIRLTEDGILLSDLVFEAFF